MKALEAFELWNRRAIACIALIRLGRIGIPMLLHCDGEASCSFRLLQRSAPLDEIFELDVSSLAPKPFGQ
jgi:hypothetical protein